MLTRIACLGQWAYPHYTNNQQKVRADRFVAILSGEPRPHYEKAMEIVVNKGISGMIRQQQDLSWLSAPPQEFDLLYMDSFADLVDQRFRHKHEGWSFCACFSDVDQPNIHENFICEDLVPLSLIEQSYDTLFSWFRSKTQTAPIIFVHFPLTFETRDKYLRQGAAISSAIQNLKATHNIHNIIVPPDRIEQHPTAQFTYHFGPETIAYVSEVIKEITNRS
jgi:hypothetical protein